MKDNVSSLPIVTLPLPLHIVPWILKGTQKIHDRFSYGQKATHSHYLSTSPCTVKLIRTENSAQHGDGDWPGFCHGGSTAKKDRKQCTEWGWRLTSILPWRLSKSRAHECCGSQGTGPQRPGPHRCPSSAPPVCAGWSTHTNGYKYCHRSVWKHKWIQILSQECLEAQKGTNTLTGVFGNTDGYKCCHWSVWRQKIMDTNTVTGVSGNTNGHKYCHTVYLQTQIDTNTVTWMCGNTKGHKCCHRSVWYVETQIDTDTVTGMCENTNWYKYCHRNVWKHKLMQILSLERVKKQTDTNTVKGMCGNTNWCKYCHWNV